MKSREAREGKRAGARAAREPDHVLLAIATAGAALAGYLTVTSWTGAAPLYCAEGSDCDLVQTSRWASFLGVPVALWGVLGFGALARAALLRKPEDRFAWAWLLALVGLAVSLYLTGVSLLWLEASCAYCLASTALMAAAFAAVALRRPVLSGFRFGPWLALSGGLAAAAVASMHLYHAGLALAPPAEDPYLGALAQHLRRSGARFYGASWCEHCNYQKDLFGAAADRLPYVECSPGGRGKPTAAICSNAGVRSYPTWDIDGQRHLGALTPQRLAELSAFAR
jgi:uncharacterized membrane protein